MKSPDGHLEIALRAGSNLTWSVDHDGAPVIAPSALALTLQSGEVLGANPVVRGTKSVSVDETITPLFYKKKTIRDRYNQLTVTMQGGYAVVLRAYDDGAAYRFVLDRKGDLTVRNEEADLEAYPGMFLRVNPETRRGFQGVFTPYPEREEAIAHISGSRALPWRGVAAADRLDIHLAEGGGWTARIEPVR